MIWQTDLFGNFRGDDVSQFGLGDTVQSFFSRPRSQRREASSGAPGRCSSTDRHQRITTGNKWGAGPTFVVLKQIRPDHGRLAGQSHLVGCGFERAARHQRHLPPAIRVLHDQARHDFQHQHREHLQLEDRSNGQCRSMSRCRSWCAIGKQPVSFGVGGRYYIVRPEFGPDWGVRFVTTLLFPKK